MSVIEVEVIPTQLCSYPTSIGQLSSFLLFTPFHCYFFSVPFITLNLVTLILPRMDSIKRLKRFGHRHLHHHHRGGEIPDTPDNGEGPSTLRPSTSGASSQTTSAHSEISRPSSASATQAAQSTPSASDLQTLIPPALPATDATLQVPSPEPSQKTSLSQKLWDDAYDSIEESNAELYEAYCDTLAKALTNMKLKEMKAKGTSETPSSEPAKLSKPNIEKIKAGFAAELKERAKRQEHMQKFVKDGQERFAKGWKVAAAVGGVAQAVLSAKPVVDLVLNSVPQAAPAAIPWAGVCIGLEVIDVFFFFFALSSLHFFFFCYSLVRPLWALLINIP